MTGTVTVERIDILEGPNLEGLLRSFTVPSGLDREIEVNARFDRIKLYTGDGDDAAAILGDDVVSYTGVLLGIRYLGLEPGLRHDFIITLKTSLGTFEGHYNVHSRKGSLGRRK